ncbi:MAG: LacI family DNA-binding transcriptional regulator [Erythrobacter sp.]
MVAITRKSTAWDVAEKAGVSQSTVSRVFTGSTRISEPTRERVLQAAKELDYIPDKRASRLRSGQTGVVAVVVITKAEDSAREVNPFAYVLLGSVCRAASELGYETLVSFQASPDQFYGRHVEQRDADALIVIGTTQNPEAWAHFEPVLQGDDSAICWGLPIDDVRSVRSDNRLGGKIAAEHLWQLGYREPVFLGPIEQSQRQFHERYNGFVDALSALGGEAHVMRDLSETNRFEQGREAIARLDQAGRTYDSIFAACDFIALGALEALNERGVKVPEQVGIVGYDGIAATKHANPPLTTIRPDLEEAGRMLVAQVLASPQGEERAEMPSALAPVELLERSSTSKR